MEETIKKYKQPNRFLNNHSYEADLELVPFRIEKIVNHDFKMKKLKLYLEQNHVVVMDLKLLNKRYMQFETSKCLDQFRSSARKFIKDLPGKKGRVCYDIRVIYNYVFIGKRTTLEPFYEEKEFRKHKDYSIHTKGL